MNKNLTLASTCLILLFTLIVLSASHIGLTITRDISPAPPYLAAFAEFPIQKITIENTLIPRIITIDPPYLCAIAHTSSVPTYLPSRWHLGLYNVTRYEPLDDTVLDNLRIPLSYETISITLEAVPAANMNISALYLFPSDNADTPVCSEMTEADFAHAISIPIYGRT